ncbi:MAG: adenylate/guanylate cyclase domain-containing protein [Gammaproteobacteria bacterium]
MNQPARNAAIVFADIAGSTALFEKLGDAKARSIVAHVLRGLSDITTQYKGRVIKFIGDEIMSIFGSADAAVSASIAMQEWVLNDHGSGVPIAIRVGSQFGPVLTDPDGDVYGDTVNTAKRVGDRALAGQILVGSESVEGLSPSLKSMSRVFDQIGVKGKEAVMDIYEIMWQPEDENGTTVASAISAPPPPGTSILNISWMGQDFSLELREHESAVIGRGQQADYRMGGQRTSRIHCIIGRRRGQYIITDQSRNGTYVQPVGGAPILLRREDAPLINEGVISLGCTPDTGQPEDLVQYKIG